MSALLVTVLVTSACGSRTGLQEGGDGSSEGQGSMVPPSSGGTPSSNEPGQPTKPSKPGQCVPQEESCNGTDDDCDGAVDEDLPSVPCEGGGVRYCVDGRMSECPTRCEVCLPGSERVCFNSFCTYWGTQTCAADGRGFGKCREDGVPSECEDVAKEHQHSWQLERCCIDHGYCCDDEFDLDHDGQKHDMIGQCDEVSCSG